MEEGIGPVILLPNNSLWKKKIIDWITIRNSKYLLYIFCKFVKEPTAGERVPDSPVKDNSLKKRKKKKIC